MFTARKNYDGSVERSMDTTQSIGATSPKFSVVVPLYNKEQSIKDTINSVLEQSFRDFELIIVNDGSADNSLQVVREIKDSRIRIIDKKNGGVSSARNRGIAEAKNEWIALLDGDDLWLPHHLANLAKAISLFQCYNVFYTGYTTSNEKNFIPSFSEFAQVVDDYFRFALKGCGMWSSCICFHSSLTKKMTMFNEDFTHGEDVDLWIRLAKASSPVFIAPISSIYVLSKEGNAMSRIPHPKNVAIYSSSLFGKTTYYERVYHVRRIISATMRCGRRFPLISFLMMWNVLFKNPCLCFKGLVELFFYLWK